jgi:hypothetical protein
MSQDLIRLPVRIRVKIEIGTNRTHERRPVRGNWESESCGKAWANGPRSELWIPKPGWSRISCVKRAASHVYAAKTLPI